MSQRRFPKDQHLHQMQQQEKHVNIKQWLLQTTSGWMRSINVKLFGETVDFDSDTSSDEASHTQMKLRGSRKKRYDH